MDELLARYAKFPPRQRYAVFALVVLLVLVADWYFVYSEQATKVARLEAEYARVETERAEKQAYVENMSKYELRLKELQESLVAARSQLPDDPDVPQLLSQLGNKARQAGLEIDRFEPKGEKAQDFYAEIMFALKVRGSYHEIGTFLDAVGKLDRILNVTNLSMTAPKTVNQKVVVDCTFVVKAYRFLEKPDGKGGGK
jgi:type IV pilus assembly protein PilO